MVSKVSIISEKIYINYVIWSHRSATWGTVLDVLNKLCKIAKKLNEMVGSRAWMLNLPNRQQGCETIDG